MYVLPWISAWRRASNSASIGGPSITTTCGAKRADRRHFLRSRRRSDIDGNRDAREGSRPGDALAMISGGGGNHASPARGLIQHVDLVGGATDFERAGGLEVLALQQHFAPERMRTMPDSDPTGSRAPAAGCRHRPPGSGRRAPSFKDSTRAISLVSVFQPAAQPLSLEQSQPRAALVIRLRGGPEAAAVGVDLGHRRVLQALDGDDVSAPALRPLELARLPQDGEFLAAQLVLHDHVR